MWISNYFCKVLEKTAVSGRTAHAMTESHKTHFMGMGSVQIDRLLNVSKNKRYNIGSI